MEKLELKHLAPYLPYNLTCLLTEFNDDCFVIGASEDYVYTDSSFDELYYTEIKPILRPLSDLTREIEIDGCKFIPNNLLNERFRHSSKDLTPYQYAHYNLELEVQTENYSQTLDLYDGYLIVNQLFEWHFDIFSLIDKGLAISYSDVQSTSNEG